MRVKRLVAALALLLVSLPALAQDPRRAEIIGVIGGQLEALRRDDAAAAFAFASPDIQAMFGTPENFLRMVAESYAPVYRPRSVTFLDLITQEGRVVQRVLFTGPEGEQVLALYMMAREPDGTWRIAGCILVRPETASA